MSEDIQKKDIYISIRECGEIRIHKNVLRILNNPANIELLWSKSKKMLYLSATENISAAYIAITSNFYKDGVRFKNRALYKKLCSITGIKEGTDHKFFGDFIPDLNMVAFRADEQGQ